MPHVQQYIYDVTVNDTMFKCLHVWIVEENNERIDDTIERDTRKKTQ